MATSPQRGVGPQQPPPPLAPPPRPHRSRSSADTFVYSPSSLLPIPEEEHGAEPLSLPPSAPWASGSGSQAPPRDAPGAPHSEEARRLSPFPPDPTQGLDARGSGAALCDAASAGTGLSERGGAGGPLRELNGTTQEGEGEGDRGHVKGARPLSGSLSLPSIPPWKVNEATALGAAGTPGEHQGLRQGSSAQPSARTQELLLQLQGAQQEMLERQQQEQLQEQQRQLHQQEQQQAKEQEGEWGEVHRGLPNGFSRGGAPVRRRPPARGFDSGRGPGVQRMWEGGILNCWEDSAGASQTLCCPCVTFGENMAMAGMGECPTQSLAYFGMTYGACALSQLLGLWCCNFDFFATLGLGLFFAGTAYAAQSRTDMRKRFNIYGDESTDCLYHAFCSCCALCQENRTLKANNVWRGVWSGRGDMSTGVMGRTTSWDCMAPPPEFRMSAASDHIQSPRHGQGSATVGSEPLASFVKQMLQAGLDAMAGLPYGDAMGPFGAKSKEVGAKGGKANAKEMGTIGSSAAEGDVAPSQFPPSSDSQLSPRSHPFSASANGLTEAPFLRG